MFDRIAAKYGRFIARSPLTLPWSRRLAQGNPTDYGKMVLTGMLVVGLRVIATDSAKRRQHKDRQLAVSKTLAAVEELQQTVTGQLAKEVRKRRDLRVCLNQARQVMVGVHPLAHAAPAGCRPENCQIADALDRINGVLAEQGS